ncbi:MAG TPA: efflux RND transporter periplasmic adaptor subunit, partial [Hellea balneolensis]|nr:efflux RND transporter periplasmic adaptor subunit [Hellea balneolensis]
WTSPHFVDGGRFTKGEVLVRIDPSNYKFAIEQARANVADAKAKLDREIAEGEIARQDWEDINGDKPATDLALRKPQLAGAKAALASAQARVHKAELDLARTEIRAPFDGRIETKRVDLGQYVSPGTVLAQVYATDVAEVYLPLTNSQLAKINLDALFNSSRAKKDLPPVDLSAEIGGRTFHWTGHIVRTSGSIDQANRVLNLIVEIDNPYEARNGQPPLMNGLFVNAEIPGVRLDNVVEIPRSALRNENEVVTVDADNRMHIRRIELVQADRKKALIRGLDDGTDIITSALDAVVEGMQVERSDAHRDENAAITNAKTGAGE